MKTDSKRDRWHLVGGALAFLVFSQVNIWTDFPFETPAMMLGTFGLIWMIAHLRRSTVELATRLFLSVNLVNLAIPCVATPSMFGYPLVRIGFLALGVGIVGGLIPRKIRRKAYGLMLAFVWALFLGTAWEESGAPKAPPLFVFAFAGAALGWLTVLYVRWAKTGLFPKAMAEFLQLLPEDDSPAWERVLNKPAPVAPIRESSDEVGERVSVGER